MAWDGEVRLPACVLWSLAEAGRSVQQAGKLRADFQPMTMDNRWLFVSQVHTSCPIFPFKKIARLVLFCNCFFNESPQSGPYFLVNSRENLNSGWPSSFNPVEMDMKLGMCQSDEGTLILAVLEGCPWGRLGDRLWLSVHSTQHSLHLDIPFL